MSLPTELLNQVMALPLHERYELANRLLDTVHDDAAAGLELDELKELQQRRDEMLRGEKTIDDWRAALNAIKASLKAEQNP